jgi:hypothetical protein
VRAETFYRTVTMDHTDLMSAVLRLLEAAHVPYCVIGGQAVNAYAEPLVSLDLDLVIATERIDDVLAMMPAEVRIERCAHSVHVSQPGSELRIQFQLDPRYAAFLPRASVRQVLGTAMRVADVDDVLTGKIWAAEDVERRASKRQKDLADIARLIETHPELRHRVPRPLLDRLL